jgi:DNA-binding transcriptional ArsR family regulator
MDPLEAISEPRRREILALLTELGEVSVTELAEHLPVTRPAVSQHLRILLDNGLVHERRSGRRSFYRVNAEGVARARSAIEVFLVNELDDLETAARNFAGLSKEDHG